MCEREREESVNDFLILELFLVWGWTFSCLSLRLQHTSSRNLELQKSIKCKKFDRYSKKSETSFSFKMFLLKFTHLRRL